VGGTVDSSPTGTSVVGVPVDVCFNVEAVILHLRNVEDLSGHVVDLREEVGVEIHWGRLN